MLNIETLVRYPTTGTTPGTERQSLSNSGSKGILPESGLVFYPHRHVSRTTVEPLPSPVPLYTGVSTSGGDKRRMGTDSKKKKNSITDRDNGSDLT